MAVFKKTAVRFILALVIYLAMRLAADHWSADCQFFTGWCAALVFKAIDEAIYG